MKENSSLRVLVSIAERAHRFGSLKRQGVALVLPDSKRSAESFTKMPAAKPLDPHKVHTSYGI